MRSRAVAGSWAYSATAGLFVPDTRYTSLPDGFSAVPLRGNAYTLAVCEPGGACVGWILWDEASKKSDQGP